VSKIEDERKIVEARFKVENDSLRKELRSKVRIGV
jgi:hypothetical protein